MIPPRISAAGMTGHPAPRSLDELLIELTDRMLAALHKGMLEDARRLRERKRAVEAEIDARKPI